MCGRYRIKDTDELTRHLRRTFNIPDWVKDRMPAILSDEVAKRWLSPGPLSADEVVQLTEPYPPDGMEAIAISTLVNSPRNDTPEVLIPAEKLERGGGQGELFEI